MFSITLVRKLQRQYKYGRVYFVYFVCLRVFRVCLQILGLEAISRIIT